MILNKFLIVVPFWNVQEWIAEAINSILIQTYPHYRVLLIDDAGQDDSFQIAQDCISNYYNFLLIKNSTNKGALWNKTTSPGRAS